MRYLGLIVLLIAQQTSATCFPENHQWVAAQSKSSVSYAQFKSAIAQVQKYYGPIVAKQGATLQINDMWSDGTVNSQAYRSDDNRTWFVDAFGGLARFHGMTQMGFALVLCHEVGHHLGGAPRFNHNTDWASVEGEADYFATTECMRHIAPTASATASQVLGNVLADLGGERHPRMSTPDQHIVPITYEDHPAAQCRFDTYTAGQGDKARPRCWYAP